MPTAPSTPSPSLSIEAIVAVDTPREFRLHPRERIVAYTAEVAGTRQLFTLSLRGGYPSQISASAKSVSDPQWSPDGRRLAFLSRRRGWAQVWLIDAPVPRRGRPASEPRPPRATALTEPGIDIDGFEWAPDGNRLAVMAHRGAEPIEASQIAIVDVADGSTRVVAGETSVDSGVAWLSDGSLLFTSDADGWFHVVRLTADGHDRIVLTSGDREHGTPGPAAPGIGLAHAPLPSPDETRFVHIEIHDGLQDLLVGQLAGAQPPKRGRGRPPKTPRVVTAAAAGARINPWDGVWRVVGWLADGAWVAAVGERVTAPQDLWLLPVPGVAPDGARPRQVTDSMPAVLRAALQPSRVPPAERITVTARDGLRVEGTLWRPHDATGKRRGRRVPTIIFPHGGPTAQAFRAFLPFKQVLVAEGFALFDVDFRGSSGYGREFRLANHGEWGGADVNDLIDAARWAAAQPWSDGRLAIYGGSYGGYMVLCALVEEPSLWRAGVDLFGDSEIAESYRHGDRVGRRDLHKMMGSPDDPARATAYRRGSPVYRAERIEAPLLILHGRKDKRVVPLMTERMVEALEIEGKAFEVHWYDDEGHGWERRENRRDAFERTLAFLKLHLGDEAAG